MPIAIKVENLSKAYQLGEIGTGTLANDLQRSWARLRGKEDPFLTIGEINDRTTKGVSDVVWSLKDINFKVSQGDTVGIIGRNGAGKSTLLKLLSRVTAPTTGSVKMKGRIASLLEVGTGFHPDLSGRENIYLNGAILGMRKAEITRKFDEIVAFSGVERYIDTPVKRYSSGMYVRLAFAVAAHLESEILIIDEVLAVGDAEFQKKCLGKMGDVSRKDGRTILFVSHNIKAISQLCVKGIYLNNGQLRLQHDIDEIVKCYSHDRNLKNSKTVRILSDGKKAWLSNFLITESDGNEHVEMAHAKIVHIEIESTKYLDNIFVGIGINDLNDIRIVTLFSKFYQKSFKIKPGKNIIKCSISDLYLKPGVYKVEVFIGNDFETFDYYDSGLEFEIFPSLKQHHLLPDSSQGNIYIEQDWN